MNMSNYLSDEKKEELAKLAGKVTPGQALYEFQGIEDWQLRAIADVAANKFLNEPRTNMDSLGLASFMSYLFCKVRDKSLAAVSSLIEENAELKADNAKLQRQADGQCDGCGAQLEDAYCTKCLLAAEAERDKLHGFALAAAIMNHSNNHGSVVPLEKCQKGLCQSWAALKNGAGEI